MAFRRSAFASRSIRASSASLGLFFAGPFASSALQLGQ